MDSASQEKPKADTKTEDLGFTLTTAHFIFILKTIPMTAALIAIATLFSLAVDKGHHGSCTIAAAILFHAFYKR